MLASRARRAVDMSSGMNFKPALIKGGKWCSWAEIRPQIEMERANGKNHRDHSSNPRAPRSDSA